MKNSDWIRIRGLEIDCVVGVYPHERDTPQPLRLDAELCLDTEPAAKRERLRLSVDYAAIGAQLAFLLKNCRFRMLETAAHALCRYLLAPPAPGDRRAQITRARIRLEKPTALGGLAVPSLEIERAADDVEIGQEQKPFGTVDVIHETRDAGIYRLERRAAARHPAARAPRDARVRDGVEPGPVVSGPAGGGGHRASLAARRGALLSQPDAPLPIDPVRRLAAVRARRRGRRRR